MPKQPEELLKPTQVYAEYGIKPRCLSYMRTQTKDTGELIGPQFIQQGHIIFYKRKWIDNWQLNNTFVPAVQIEQSEQTDKKTSNIHKFQKSTS